MPIYTPFCLLRHHATVYMFAQLHKVPKQVFQTDQHFW